MRKNSSKIFFVFTIGMTVLCLLVAGGITAFMDPFFHYHAPLDNIAYVMNSPRYQNDGILRNFEYDSIITGSSMSEAFKSSEFDELFDTNSVKVPFQGAYFKEIHQRLNRALETHKVDYVISSLDNYAINANKDTVSNFDYPEYLYDNNLLNDVQYFLNKDTLINYTLNTISNTIDGGRMKSFDEYAATEGAVYGRAAVMSVFTPTEKTEHAVGLSESERKTSIENIEHNIISLVKAYPETEFYLFFPPASVLYWEDEVMTQTFDAEMERHKNVASLLLEHENVRVFLFLDAFDVVCNLENYRDTGHYSPEVSSQLLVWMKNGEYELSKDTIDARFDSVCDFYKNYDYEAVYSN